MQEQLSIIIVNYKTPGLLKQCLRTVFNQQGAGEFEVIVVDNDSRDDSRNVVLTDFPSVKWIQMDTNAGFARANNEGIRQSRGTAILLLNSDTLIQENAVTDSFELLMSAAYVACGVQLLNRDGSAQISGNYFMKGGLNNLLPLPYVGAIIKAAGLLFRVEKPHADRNHQAQEVDWINGAYLMVKTEAIRKAGLMDEDFFLYAEEAEWCYRLRKFGKLVVYGHLHVIHLQGETSNEAFGSSGQGYANFYDKKGLQIMLSNFVRLRKQWGRGWFLFQLLIYTLTIPVMAVAAPIEAIVKGRNLAEALKRTAAFAENVGSIWKLSTKIMQNKPYFYKVL